LTTSSPQLETRVIEILDAIREVLNRLATLEEKTIWHNNIMSELSSGQKEMDKRVSDLYQDRGRIALLERELQYLTGDLAKQSKQVEVLTGFVQELTTSDKIQGRTFGFIEKSAGSFILALISAGAGAIIFKLFGAN
jgi:predicted RNase H-like nuclease (RuvC/YqgF family)